MRVTVGLAAAGRNEGIPYNPAIGTELVGRGSELAKLAGFLAAPLEPALVLVEGEPGIGKTAVWEESVTAAAGRGVRVLSCRCAEAESRFGFGGLVDLLADPVAVELLAELPAPQRQALEVALLLDDGDLAGGRAAVVSVAVLNLVRALARRSEVLVAVDDLHWLDPASARVLAYVARRLDDRPVALLATSRPSPLPGGLDRIVSERLGLDGLSLAAVQQLLASRLDLHVSRPRLVRLARVSGGNPLLALELGRTLLEHEPADAAGEVPVPERLRQTLAERLATLSPAAREAVVTAATLWRPTPALVEAAVPVGGLEDALVANVLRVEGPVVQPTHPLLGSVVYGGLGPAARRRLHTTLARLELPEEEQAWHAAHAASGPDAATAAQLEHAAERARSRGAIDAAAELGRLALRATPADDGELTLRRSIAVGLDEFLAGDEMGAHRRWLGVVAAAPPGPIRAEARWHLLEYHGAPTTVEIEALAEAALGDLAGAESEAGWLAARIHVSAGGRLLWRGRLAKTELHLREGVRLAESAGDRVVSVEGLALAAVADFYAGRDWRESMDGALRAERGFEPAPIEQQAAFLETAILTWSGDLAARERLAGWLEEAVERGQESAIPIIRLSLAELAYAAGDVDELELHAGEAHAAVELMGSTARRGYVRFVEALAATMRGRLEPAHEAALDGLALAERHGLLQTASRNRWLLGFLDLQLGRFEAAAAWLEPLEREMLETGHAGAHSLRFVSDLAEALVALGRVDEARSRLDAFGAVVPAAAPWLRAAAERAAAVADAATGSHDEAIARLERARMLFDEAGRPFEAARASLALGSVARRGRRRGAAAAAFRSAEARFVELGAEGWATRARGELERVGLQRSDTALTGTERRIAELVATGRTNKEIAGLLYMSEKAVEGHLTRSYRKLGIRSRSQLAALVGSDGSAPVMIERDKRAE